MGLRGSRVDIVVDRLLIIYQAVGPVLVGHLHVVLHMYFVPRRYRTNAYLDFYYVNAQSRD